MAGSTLVLVASPRTRGVAGALKDAALLVLLVYLVPLVLFWAFASVAWLLRRALDIASRA